MLVIWSLTVFGSIPYFMKDVNNIVYPRICTCRPSYFPTASALTENVIMNEISLLIMHVRCSLNCV